VSELLQLLTMAPYPLPSGVRVQSFALPEDDLDDGHCPKCKRDELPIEAFYIRPDGRRSSWCKCCTRAKSAQRRRQSDGCVA